MKKFKTILISILAVLPSICTAIAVFFILPDTVAAHFNIHGQVDRYGSKYEILPFPAIILGIALFFFIIRKAAKIASTDDDKAARNLDILDTAILLIFVFFNVLCIFILTVMRTPTIMTKNENLFFVIISAIMGIIFILLGNIMPKTKRNSWIGVRIPFCMDTDEHWYIANRAGGIAMLLAGLCTVLVGLIVLNSSCIFYMILSLILFLTVAIIYSYVKIKGKK